MCIAFILWQCHPRYRFFLALNRDELHSRPTLPVHWWPEQDDILAGKDLSKGGTWFGCTKNGRMAVVTSVREVNNRVHMVSRGELITSFLKSSKDPLEYAQEVFEAGDNYNGFNLLVADLCVGRMAYVTNRPKDKPVQAQIVMPGFHVLCNASLNTPWPKVLRGRSKLDNLMKDNWPCEIPKERALQELLMDDVKADRASLPQTGYSVDWEHELSSLFVNCISSQGPYGTRSMIVFAVDNDGQVNLFERFLEDGCWKEHEYAFEISREAWMVSTSEP
eukprot:c21942_g1_i1 orf=219-1049(+)